MFKVNYVLPIITGLTVLSSAYAFADDTPANDTALFNKFRAIQATNASKMVEIQLSASAMPKNIILKSYSPGNDTCREDKKLLNKDAQRHYESVYLTCSAIWTSQPSAQGYAERIRESEEKNYANVLKKFRVFQEQYGSRMLHIDLQAEKEIIKQYPPTGGSDCLSQLKALKADAKKRNESSQLSCIGIWSNQGITVIFEDGSNAHQWTDEMPD